MDNKLMKKMSEPELASVIQAYVFGYGDRQQMAGVIRYQLDNYWMHQKDYILECTANAMNNDDSKNYKVTPSQVYSDLAEEAYGWTGATDKIMTMVACPR